MEPRNPPQYVLITGASSGIGRACAKHLDQKGFHVIAGVRRDEDAKILQDESSNRLTPILLDVCSQDSISAASERAAALTSPFGLTGLVNNAGISLVGPLEYINLNKFRKQIETNLVGMIAITQHLLPLLRKQRGRIINIGSISGRVALPFLGPYAATKFAIEAISDSLRVELRPWDIPVSIIEPGNVSTPIREKAITGLKEDMQNFPADAHTLYGPILDSAFSHKNKKTGEPGLVAKTVERALTVRRPRHRYLLGTDAHIISLIQKLPTSIRDLLIARQLPPYGQT